MERAAEIKYQTFNLNGNKQMHEAHRLNRCHFQRDGIFFEPKLKLYFAKPTENILLAKEHVVCW